jgi:hypothetical protein
LLRQSGRPDGGPGAVHALIAGKDARGKIAMVIMTRWWRGSVWGMEPDAPTLK